MKTHRHLYLQVHDFENLYQAYRKARKGKRGRSEVAEFEFFLEDNLVQLQDELAGRTYRHGAYRSFTIHEKIRGGRTLPRCAAPPDAERRLGTRSHVGVLAPHHFSNSISRDGPSQAAKQRSGMARTFKHSPTREERSTPRCGADFVMVRGVRRGR